MIFPSSVSKLVVLISVVVTWTLVSCEKDEPQVVLDPAPYILDFGSFSPAALPADNMPTNAGVQLGRMLFYEKALSKNGLMSCADCHQQKDMFSDSRQFSLGVDSLPGRRQAMPVFNLALHRTGFFWDGRAATIREQALHPIQDPVEMNESLDNVVSKLNEMKVYRDQFTRAFGSPDITTERIGLAIEQFEVTIISIDSKYDRFEKGMATLTEAEERGRQLFFNNHDPANGIKGGECVHCHGGPNFANDFFVNNGLDKEADFTDLGRFEITQLESDKAVFKVPSLRNIALTAPYMHDGRFATLAEVIDHYNTGVKNSSTLHHSMGHNTLHGGLQLNAQDKSDLVEFLETLTEEGLLTDQRFSSPF